MSMLTNDKVPIDMFAALNEWRVQRNQCVHAAAKSEPGTKTIPVQTFIDMAESAAIRGKELARLVCDWHRQIKS